MKRFTYTTCPDCKCDKIHAKDGFVAQHTDNRTHSPARGLVCVGSRKPIMPENGPFTWPQVKANRKAALDHLFGLDRTIFRRLAVGDSFDFIDPANPSKASFTLRCTKTTARGYRDERNVAHKIGTINCTVYHVTKK